MGEKNPNPRIKEQYKGNAIEAKKNAPYKAELRKEEMRGKAVELWEREEGENCPPEQE